MRSPQPLAALEVRPAQNPLGRGFVLLVPVDLNTLAIGDRSEGRGEEVIANDSASRGTSEAIVEVVLEGSGSARPRGSDSGSHRRETSVERRGLWVGDVAGHPTDSPGVEADPELTLDEGVATDHEVTAAADQHAPVAAPDHVVRDFDAAGHVIQVDRVLPATLRAAEVVDEVPPDPVAVHGPVATAVDGATVSGLAQDIEDLVALDAVFVATEDDGRVGCVGEFVALDDLPHAAQLNRWMIGPVDATEAVHPCPLQPIAGGREWTCGRPRKGSRRFLQCSGCRSRAPRSSCRAGARRRSRYWRAGSRGRLPPRRPPRRSRTPASASKVKPSRTSPFVPRARRMGVAEGRDDQLLDTRFLSGVGNGWPEEQHPAGGVDEELAGRVELLDEIAEVVAGTRPEPVAVRSAGAESSRAPGFDRLDRQLFLGPVVVPVAEGPCVLRQSPSARAARERRRPS